MDTQPWLASIRAIVWKEFVLEARTRELVTTAGFFAVLTTIMSALAFPQERGTSAGAIWLPLAFAAVLAVGRSWQREREEGVFTALLLAPIPRGAIFLGKMIAMLGILLVLAAMVIPISALFFHVDLGPHVLPLLCVVFFGLLGVAAAGTLFGAMTVRTNARELILAAVMLPLLTPVLLVGVSATTRLVELGGGFDTVRDYVLIELAFDTLFTIGGAAVFGMLVEG
jgi:heme exporter protein B